MPSFPSYLDTLSKGTEVAQRMSRVKNKQQRLLNLSLCNISDYTFGLLCRNDLLHEKGLFNHIVRLDLGHNNLQILPEAVSGLQNLEELWLNDNPLLVRRFEC